MLTKKTCLHVFVNVGGTFISYQETSFNQRTKMAKYYGNTKKLVVFQAKTKL